MNDFDQELPQFDAPIDLISSFDYDRLEESTRILVITRAGEIKILMKQNAENIIQIGLKLIEVKECLGHGQFGNWLSAEFEWSQDTANNFMRVALRFGQIPKFSEFDIAPSALYLLATPSTPDAARSAALERAAQGDRITHKVAKQIVASVKQVSCKKRKPAPNEETEPHPIDRKPNALPEGYLPPVSPESLQEQENVCSQVDSGVFINNSPPSNYSPPIESDSSPVTSTSTCDWNRDRHGQLKYRVEIGDSNVGRKIEVLAKECGKLPQTIVALGIEALEAMPEKERRITELTLQVRTLVEEKAVLNQVVQEKESQIQELEQTCAQRDSRLEELEELCAQKDNALERTAESLSTTNETCATLENEKADLSAKLSAEISQFNAALDKTEAIIVEQHGKIRLLESQLAECQSPKSSPTPPPLPIPKQVPVPVPVPVPNLKPLIDFFDLAAQKLEKPSIQLHINDHTLVIARNSRSYKGNHVGCLNINDWEGHWHGRINKDGRLFKSREWQEWVMPILLEFAANPVVVAQQHGKKTGACCFCNRVLTDKHSLDTGYGETCAKHYGLPYPHLAVTQ